MKRERDDRRNADRAPGGRTEGALVLFPGALGDAVCLEPTIALLARAGPVTVHARGAAAEVAALYPARPLVRSLDGVELARLFSLTDDPCTGEWLESYQRVLSFTGVDVPQVVRRVQAAGGVCARFPRPPLDAHATDLFLRAARGDASADGAQPRLTLPDTATGARDGHTLILLPGGSSTAKRAPRELLAALATRWRDRGGAVDVLLGPAEGAEDDFWRSAGRVLRPDGVAALAARIAAGAAFVGNDSGPSHVAAALGVPGVVLYAATLPEHYGPRGAAIASLRLSTGSDLVDAAWAVVRGHLP
jgi:hypothetical protein